MSKSNPKNQKEWISFLKKQGWEESRGGRHATLMIHPSGKRVPLSQHHGGDYTKNYTAKIKRQIAEAEDQTEDDDE